MNVNIVTKDMMMSDEQVYTSTALADLRKMQCEFEKFVQNNDVRIYREFFKSIVSDYLEAWLEDYYSNQDVADDNEAIKYLDDDYDEEWESPYSSKQEAFDVHVEVLKAMMEKAIQTMLNSMLEAEAKAYGVTMPEHL